MSVSTSTTVERSSSQTNPTANLAQKSLATGPIASEPLAPGPTSMSVSANAFAESSSSLPNLAENLAQKSLATGQVGNLAASIETKASSRPTIEAAVQAASRAMPILATTNRQQVAEQRANLLASQSLQGQTRAQAILGAGSRPLSGVGMEEEIDHPNEQTHHFASSIGLAHGDHHDSMMQQLPIALPSGLGPLEELRQIGRMQATGVHPFNSPVPLQIPSDALVGSQQVADRISGQVQLELGSNPIGLQLASEMLSSGRMSPSGQPLADNRLASAMQLNPTPSWGPEILKPVVGPQIDLGFATQSKPTPESVPTSSASSGLPNSSIPTINSEPLMMQQPTSDLGFHGASSVRSDVSSRTIGSDIIQDGALSSPAPVSGSIGQEQIAGSNMQIGSSMSGQIVRGEEEAQAYSQAELVSGEKLLANQLAESKQQTAIQTEAIMAAQAAPSLPDLAENMTPPTMQQPFGGLGALQAASAGVEVASGGASIGAAAIREAVRPEANWTPALLGAGQAIGAAADLAPLMARQAFANDDFRRLRAAALEALAGSGPLVRSVPVQPVSGWAPAGVVPGAEQAMGLAPQLGSPFASQSLLGPAYIQANLGGLQLGAGSTSNLLTSPLAPFSPPTDVKTQHFASSGLAQGVRRKANLRSDGLVGLGLYDYTPLEPVAETTLLNVLLDVPYNDRGVPPLAPMVEPMEPMALMAPSSAGEMDPTLANGYEVISSRVIPIAESADPNDRFSATSEPSNLLNRSLEVWESFSPVPDLMEAKRIVDYPGRPIVVDSLTYETNALVDGAVNQRLVDDGGILIEPRIVRVDSSPRIERKVIYPTRGLLLIGRS